MKVDFRVTAARAGVVPLHPRPRPKGAGLVVGKLLGGEVTAARRQASRAGVVPLHPRPRPEGAGLVVGKLLGGEVTAARQQASRLAVGVGISSVSFT